LTLRLLKGRSVEREHFATKAERLKATLYRNPSTGVLRNFHAKSSRTVRQRMLRTRREAAMKEREIKAYFELQVRMVIERSAKEPEGFLSYFSSHEPKDEEILGLLSVSTMLTGDFHRGESFPTPVEALAALSAPDRTEICNYFREQLRNFLRHIGSA
jgi:hypothetical protein